VGKFKYKGGKQSPKRGKIFFSKKMIMDESLKVHKTFIKSTFKYGEDLFVPHTRAEERADQVQRGSRECSGSKANAKM